MHTVYTEPVRCFFPRLQQFISEEVLRGRRSLCGALLDAVGTFSPEHALSHGRICLFLPKSRGQTLSWVPAIAQFSLLYFLFFKMIG